MWQVANLPPWGSVIEIHPAMGLGPELGLGVDPERLAPRFGELPARLFAIKIIVSFFNCVLHYPED